MNKNASFATTKINLLATLSIICILLHACAPLKHKVASTTPLILYEAIPDASEKKSLRGILTIAQITTDTAFGWYAQNAQYFHPDSAVVQAIRKNKEKAQIVIFGGTWCHDTQQLLPKYFTTLQAANFPLQSLTLIGVDRAKTTIGNLHKIFNITNVPTLIVLVNGTEKGRIVEFGKTGYVDKELAEIFDELK